MEIKVNAQSLAGALKRASFVTEDATEPEILCGIAFLKMDDQLRIMGADRRRATIEDLPIESDDGAKEQSECSEEFDCFVVPQEKIDKLIEFLSKQSALISIDSNYNEIRFNGEGVFSSISLLGSYPYLWVLFPDPNKYRNNVSISRSELLEALEALDQPSVLLDFSSSGHLKVGAKEIDVSGDFTPATILFNLHFISAPLTVVESSQIGIHFINYKSPVLMTGDTNWRHQIMPMLP